MNRKDNESNRTGLEIAVIGMAGKFPGAHNITQFWKNLEQGVEAISFFSDPELEGAGLSVELTGNTNYVKAKGYLEESEYFDAAFFEYLPGEAEVMDPQMRLFHECTWTALEDAGYDPGTYPGFIGVYTGASPGLNWQVLSMLTGAGRTLDQFSIIQLRDKDFLATRLAYKLNLKGPAFTLATACSTSLMAVNLACQGMLSGECDIALAGGVSLPVPQKSGYIFQDGMIESEDGHCRAFDSRAKGMVAGNGAAVVVLKLLEQAIADRDHIYAIIKGSAANNDGFRKAGFPAPSIDGQAEVIKTAMQLAEVEPESIGYVETHGTGTKLGDPVEMAALKLAFDTEKRNYCAIGSVKSNIGHLDCAAGVTGLIKAVLVLKHKLIPPSLHFESPNPGIDFAGSPFYVNNRVSEWEHGGTRPRRAGVSAFGIGGTNAHVILEEWPDPTCVGERLADSRYIHENQSPVPSTKVFAPLFSKSGPPEAEAQLILLSAKSKTALDHMTVNLAEYFKENPHIDLADAAYTLQVGRKAFKHRRMFCCANTGEAASLLASPDPDQVKSFTVRKEDRPVIFMFSGQGSQYVNMGRGLYESQPLFRQIMDECFDILKTILDFDLKEVLYSHPPTHEHDASGGPPFCKKVGPKTFHEGQETVPVGARRAVPGSTVETQNLASQPFEEHERRGEPGVPPPVRLEPTAPLTRTEITQPVIFMVEYALAKLLMSWGIEPYAMIGHSIGEYTAACLAGVFSLEDALRLVVKRGRLMQSMPAGSMLSVPAPEEELTRLLKGKDLSLAAVNSSKQCVLSGSHEAVAAFAEELESAGIKTRRLHTSHAFHSPMMEPVLAEFTTIAAGVALNEPRLPYISNVTGTWINTSEAIDPGYWARQIRSTVRFADGVGELLEQEQCLFLEVGPGSALCTLVRQHEAKKSGRQTVNLMRHAKEDGGDLPYLMNRIGQCWLYGAKIDWTGFHDRAECRRVSLPTYPFEGYPFQADGNPFTLAFKLTAGTSSLRRKADMADWFYVPSWERSQVGGNGGEASSPWLVFTDDRGMAEVLVEDITCAGETFVRVKAGVAFECVAPGEYLLNPAEPGDYDSLFRELKRLKKVPTRIAHFWTVGEEMAEPDLKNIERSATAAYDVTKRDSSQAELSHDNESSINNSLEGSATAAHDVTKRDSSRKKSSQENKILTCSNIESAQDKGLFSLFYLVRTMGKMELTGNIRIAVVSDGLHRVTGEEVLCPEKATLMAAVKIVPLEYPEILCKSIDIPGSDITPVQRDILLQEVRSDYSRNIVAIRGSFSWVPVWKSRRLSMQENQKSNCRLRDKGVCLITGGMGGMGFSLAEYFALNAKSRLILIGRSPFPARREWDRWLKEHGPDDKVSLKIEKIRLWEEKGAEVMIESADISNLKQMREIVKRAQQRFGSINGVVHSAGVADYEGIIRRRDRRKTEAVMASKVKGTLVLDRVLRDVQLDFFALFSSIGNVLYKIKFGEVGYNAANEFLDAYAYYKSGRSGTFVTVINWCGWREVGMAVEALRRRGSGDEENRAAELQGEGDVTPAQGVALFNRILDSDLVQVSVSPQDLNALLTHLEEGEKAEPGPRHDPYMKTVAATSYQLQDRPDLNDEYTAPVTEMEIALTEVWQSFFGIGRIGVNDDFFELGGDSLQAMNLASHIHRELDLSVPVQVFFDRPTIRKLAEYLTGSGDNVAFARIEPAGKKEFYPLASAQKRIYILQQADENDTSYNQPMVSTLNIQIDYKKIADTVEKLIRRHESLRTSFHLIDDKPVQKIHDPGDIEFEIEYYETGLASGGQGAFLKNRPLDPQKTFDDRPGDPSPVVGARRAVPGDKSAPVQSIITNFVRPFDLSRPPLFRVGLIEIEDKRCVFIVDLHHIAADGASYLIFLNEFIRLYGGEELPPIRLQYKDFSEWQNRKFQSGEIKRQEEYWLNEFAGDLPDLDLHLDFVRPEVRNFTGDKVGFRIDGEEVEELKRIAGDTDATMFMVVLALYNVFLHKISGQEDVVVGTVAAGRGHADLQDIIGMFVNTLPLRNYPAGEKTFAGILGEVKESTLKAFDNQDYQFEELVNALQAGRDTARNPLFDMLFTYRVEEGLQVEETGSDKQDYSYRDTQSKFDLILSGIESGEFIIFVFTYAAGLFKQETIERFAVYFREIVTAITKNSKIKLSDITISHDLGELKSDVYRGKESDFDF